MDPLKELKRVAEKIAGKFGGTLTALDPDGHSWTFEVSHEVRPAKTGEARIEIFHVPAGGASGVETDGFGVGVWRDAKEHGVADNWAEFMDFSDDAVTEAIREIGSTILIEPMERDRSEDLEAKMKFDAKYELTPAFGRLKDLGALGYLTIDGIEDPGDEVPGGMNVQDWVLYRENWLSASKRLPQGGTEGEEAFLKENPGGEYLGDIVHENGFINVYKGAPLAVQKAKELISELQNYPILDEGLYSEIEDEALNEEVDRWAWDDAVDALGYHKDISEILTDDEAAWLAGLEQSDPKNHQEVMKALDGIMDPRASTEKESAIASAIKEGLRYGDWTVVHVEPVKEALASSVEGSSFADPETTVHEFIKSQMASGVPGTKEYQEAIEKQGQMRLFESLKGVQLVMGGRDEIKKLLASQKSVKAALDMAGPIAKIVGGHAPDEMFGGAFFTYASKGRLMAACVTAYPEQTFGVAWAPMKMFRDAKHAAGVLVGNVMKSFEVETKPELIARTLMSSMFLVENDDLSDDWPAFDSKEKAEAWIRERVTEIADANIENGKGMTGTRFEGMDRQAIIDELFAENVDSITVRAKGAPGFEKTIKKMKKGGKVDNPWALSWWMKKQGYQPHAGKKVLSAASRARMKFWAKTPKGYEKVVKELKKNPEVESPWAVAWSMKKKGYKTKAAKTVYIAGHLITVKGKRMGYFEAFDTEVEILDGPKAAGTFKEAHPEAYEAYIQSPDPAGHAGAGEDSDEVYLVKDDRGDVVLVHKSDISEGSGVKANDEGSKLFALVEKLKSEGFMGVELEHPGFISVKVPGLPQDYTVWATPWFNESNKLDIQLDDPNGMIVNPEEHGLDVDDDALHSSDFPEESEPVEAQASAFKRIMTEKAPGLVEIATAYENSGAGVVTDEERSYGPRGKGAGDED